MTIEAPRTKRHIAFCERVIAGEPLGEAWAASAKDVGKEPGTRAANNVSGSRMAARFADFIAAGKMQRAQARTVDDQPVTRETIHQLMEGVTEQLMQAATAADAAGAQNIATTCRRLITTHAGRSHRANTRAPVKDAPLSEYDMGQVQERLMWCDCDE